MTQPPDPTPDPTPDPDREAWLAARREGIGSSDAAAVLGLSPHKTPLHVYLDKLGELPAHDSPAMRWGRLLEPVVAQVYEETTGRRVRPPPARTLAHPEHPFLLASLDRVFEAGGETRVLEIKTSQRAEGWGEPGSDEVPDDVVAQVQHQLFVAGLARADVALLAGVHDFRVYHLAASPRWQQAALPAYVAFWARVTLRQPPELDWRHPASYELAREMHGVEAAKRVALGADAQALVEAWQAAKQAARHHEEEARHFKARVLAAVGDAAVADLPGGGRLLRRPVHRPSYQVAETDYVALTYKG